MEVHNDGVHASFFMLTPPGQEGAEYTSLAKHLDGTTIGERSSPSAQSLFAKWGFSGTDVMEANSKALETITEILPSINLAADPTLNPGGTQDPIQLKLNSFDPSQPSLPIVLSLLHTADQALLTGQIGLNIASNVLSDPAQGIETATVSTQPTLTQVDAQKLASSNLEAQKQETEAVSGPQIPNGWFVGNPFVAFLMSYSEMLKVLMENKVVQGAVSIQAQDVMMSLASSTTEAIMAAAEAQRMQYIVGAITSGIAMATTVACLALTVGAASKMQPTEEMQTTESSAKIYGAEPSEVPPNVQFKEGAVYEGGKVDCSKISDQNLTTLPKNAAKPEIQAKQQDLEDLQVKQLRKQSDLDEMNDSNSTLKERDAVAKDIADRQVKIDRLSTEVKQGYSDYFRNNINEGRAMGVKYSGGKTVNGEPLQIKETDGSLRNMTEKDPECINKQGGHFDTKEQLDLKNKQITMKNDHLNQMIQKYTMISQATNQGKEMIDNAVRAAQAMPIAVQEALKEMLQTYRQLAHQLMTTANDAFKSNSDLITQMINQLNDMRQKMLQAVAAMLGAK